MIILNKLFSRLWYRSWLFWSLFLLISYTLTGFFLLPHLIKNTMVTQVKQQLGWQANVRSVELNPFTFTLTIHDFSITDNTDRNVISVKRYHNNFELRSLLEGAFTFSDLAIEDPVIHIIINPDGKTQIQQAYEQAQALTSSRPATPKTEKNPTETIPKLLFDHIGVINGAIYITDQSLGAPVHHQLNPITFHLNNFSTLIDKNGNYQLDIALGDGQSLSWSGDIGLVPLRSSGSIEITNIKAHQLWRYVKEAPYTLVNGLASITGRYNISLMEAKPSVELFDTILTLDHIQAATTNNSAVFAEIKQLSIGPLDFNLRNKSLAVKQISVDTLTLNIDRDKKGELALLAPFKDKNAQHKPARSQQTTGEAAAAATSSTQSSPSSSNEPHAFNWAIAQFAVTNSHITLNDSAPGTHANISINEIHLQLNNLSQDLSLPLDFELSYVIQDSGRSEINGRVTPQPFTLDTSLVFSELSLPIIQPYLSDQLNIILEQGKLSLNGKLQLLDSQDADIAGEFNGTVKVDNLNTKDKLLNKQIIGWNELSVSGVKVGLNPLQVDIKLIELQQPYARVIVTEDRSTNLAKLQVSPTKTIQARQEIADTSAVKERNAPPQDPPAVVPIKIDQISLNHGSAYFADLSLIPQFGTSIQNINGNIWHLSSDVQQKANVDITGTVDEYGTLLAKGKINPLSANLYTDIDLQFEKIELTSLTPYSGRYAGYPIDKGKLSLYLNYKIANRILDGQNRLILDQFELGSPVKSDEAINLPLELAIALLKDNNGIIDISLPTKGDMDDPEFEIGGLVLSALVNAITKAVTAPFSLLADLVGGDPDALNSVAFDTGSATLSEQQQQNLAQLATALKSRPQLLLEIRPMVDKANDGAALKQLALNNQLNMSEGVNSITARHIPAMEKLLYTRSGDKALIEVRKQAMTGQATNKTPTSTQKQTLSAATKTEPSRYAKALYSALLDSQPLTSLALSDLAKQRVSAIKAQLIQHHQVPNSQIFALQTSFEAQAQDHLVATTFNLTSR